jgi:outer membrane protein assembly factor BamB
MFQFDSGNAGNAPVVGPNGTVSESWHFDTSDSIQSPPVIKGDTVYFNAGDIYALSRSRGEERWSLVEPYAHSIAVTDEHLICAEGDYGDNVLEVYSLEDGVELATYDIFGYDQEALAVRDGMIYVATNALNDVDTLLYAIDPESGVEWTFESPRERPLFEGGGPHRHLSPAVTEQTVFLGTNTGEHAETEKLYAISRSDSSLRWSIDVPTHPESPLSVSNGTVYVPRRVDQGTKLHAFSAADGSEQWNVEMARTEISSVAVADGTVYVSSDQEEAPEGTGLIRALSASDGSEEWTYETEDHLVGPPVVVKDTVYASGIDRPFRERGRIYALSTSDGSERWQFETDRHVGTSPVIVDGTIYVGSKRDTVYALA